MLFARILRTTTFAAALVLAVAGCSVMPGGGRDTVVPPVPPGQQTALPDARYAPIGAPEPPGAPMVQVPGQPTTAPAPQPPAAPVKRGDPRGPVALLLPLSGPQGEIGQAMLDAAQLALFAVGDNSFELAPEDTGGTPEGAVRAMEKVLAKGAKLVLGPLLSVEVRAVTPLAQSAGVNVVAFSSDRSVAGGGVFIMGFLPRPEVERIVAHARTRGAERFAILAPRNPYGSAVSEDFQRIVQQLGGSVAAVQLYEPNQQDYTEVIKAFARFDPRAQQLQQQRQVLGSQQDEVAKRALQQLEGRRTAGNLPFDAVLIADGGKRLLSVAPLLPFYDVDPKSVQFVGTGLWDDQTLLAEPSLLGGRYAAPDPGARAAFEKQFRESYNRKPHRLATLAYDATALAAVLAKQGGEKPYDLRAVTNPSGFTGADGLFRFAPNGWVERGLAVLEVRKEGAVVVDQAPSTFQRLTN